MVTFGVYSSTSWSVICRRCTDLSISDGAKIEVGLGADSEGKSYLCRRIALSFQYLQ